MQLGMTGMGRSLGWEVGRVLSLAKIGGTYYFPGTVLRATQALYYLT